MSAYERRQLLTDQQFSCTMDEGTHEISKYTFNVECTRFICSVTKGAVYSFLEGLMVKICPELLWFNSSYNFVEKFLQKCTVVDC